MGENSLTWQAWPPSMHLKRNRPRHSKRNSADRKRMKFRSNAPSGGGETALLIAIAERHKVNGGFGSNESYMRLLR